MTAAALEESRLGFFFSEGRRGVRGRELEHDVNAY